MEQTQAMQMRQELRQFLLMEQANLLEMPDDEFHSFVTKTESNPLFQRLYQKEKVVRYQRYPKTSVSSGFYQLKEESIVDSGSIDIESLLANKEEVVRQIKQLGLDKFKRYFLFPEAGITPEEIAEECSLEVSEVRHINKLVDDFSIMSEFYHPSNIATGAIRYSKIASVEKDNNGFVIGYFSPSFARGRYAIDYQKFEGLAANGNFTEAEFKEASLMFKRLELINTRKDTMNQILQNIIDRQALYLDSGQTRSLLPLSQKELAEKIGLDPSSISRAIRNRSIEAPWGDEIPLKYFFPRPKRFKKELIRQLLKTDRELPSDETIRNKLLEKYGVAISRRSVANLRRELKVAAAHGKKRPGEEVI